MKIEDYIPYYTINSIGRQPNTSKFNLSDLKSIALRDMPTDVYIHAQGKIHGIHRYGSYFNGKEYPAWFLVIRNNTEYSKYIESDFQEDKPITTALFYFYPSLEKYFD